MSSRSRRSRGHYCDYDDCESSSSEDESYPYPYSYGPPTYGCPPYMYPPLGPGAGGHAFPGAYGPASNHHWCPPPMPGGNPASEWSNPPQRPRRSRPQPPGPPGPPGMIGGDPMYPPWASPPQTGGPPGHYGAPGPASGQLPLWIGPPEFCPPGYQNGPPLGPPMGLATGLAIGPPEPWEQQPDPNVPRIDTYRHQGDPQSVDSETLTYTHTDRSGMSNVRNLTVPIRDNGQARISDAFSELINRRGNRIEGNNQGQQGRDDQAREHRRHGSR